MAALGNALGDDVIRSDFVTPAFPDAIRPVLGVEEFSVQPRGCTITGTDGHDVSAARGPDVICGLGGDDRIEGRGGNDVDLRRRRQRPHQSAAPATTPSTATTATTASRR